MANDPLPSFISRIPLSPETQTPSISLVVPSTRARMSDVQRSAVEAQTCLPAEALWVWDADRRGSAWARNRGIEHASGDYIAFLDDDCIPPSDWLERLLDTARRFGANVVGGTYEETDGLLADCRERRNFPRTDMLDDQGFVGAGGNIMFERPVLDACLRTDGFVFNETFRISQDWELVIRCRRLDAVFAFSAARVKHLKRTNWIHYLKLQFGRGQGIAALNKRIEEDPSLSVPHRSLLWSDGASGRLARFRWLIIFWRKICGPFDVASFRRKRDFLTFWVGEKVQGLGFLWGSLISH